MITITALESSAPNLSLIPEVDMITFLVPVINEEVTLLERQNRPYGNKYGTVIPL